MENLGPRIREIRNRKGMTLGSIAIGSRCAPGHSVSGADALIPSSAEAPYRRGGVLPIRPPPRCANAECVAGSEQCAEPPTPWPGQLARPACASRASPFSIPEGCPRPPGAVGT